MWPWKRKDSDQMKEEARKERGKLAEKVIELDRARNHLEGLMKHMLEERAGKKDA